MYGTEINNKNFRRTDLYQKKNFQVDGLGPFTIFYSSKEIVIDFDRFRNSVLDISHQNIWGDNPDKNLKETLQTCINIMNTRCYYDLKGQKGVFKVIAKDIKYDYYGKQITIKKNIGNINASELNKFVDMDVWVKRTGGIGSLAKKYFRNTPYPEP